MKNLKVGKKILLAFSIVIVLVAIIVIVTIITSSSRNKDLERVNTLVELQHEANLMLDSFNSSETEIRSVFESVYAEEQYNKANALLDQSDIHYKNMKSIAESLGNFRADELAYLEGEFIIFINEFENVHANDSEVIKDIEILNDYNEQLSFNSTQIYDYIYQSAIKNGMADHNTLYQTVKNDLYTAKNFETKINNLILATQNLILTQNLDSFPQIYSMLDEIFQMQINIKAVLVQDDAKAAANTLFELLEDFEVAVQRTESTLQKTVTNIETARRASSGLKNAVTQFVEEIATEVENMNSYNIQNSQRATIILTIIGIFSAIFAFVIATFLGRQITRPLVKMRNLLVQSGTLGDLNFSDEVKQDVINESKAKDEVGESLKAYANFIDHILHISEILEEIANKNLSIDINKLSENDTMGNSLELMLQNFNEVFSEISDAANLVASSSNEIAVGAQRLAQGSTEQASTVQEISASINEIDGQMNESAKSAQSTAELGSNMSNTALDGSKKMDQMASAMNEINEASVSIGDVIKVIDDIAFQTNILALNAAVEAARAGEHGKGFAVVADEVRSLAAKSAEAAQQTSQLLSENIVKSEQGLAYTKETVESLTEIIEGIQNTNNSLQLISEQSLSTKTATTQLTHAVDQVSQVIQQNSATSEESAAASQEMNSHAQIMLNLISDFKLKNNDKFKVSVSNNETPALPGKNTSAKNEKNIDYIF